MIRDNLHTISPKKPPKFELEVGEYERKAEVVNPKSEHFSTDITLTHWAEGGGGKLWYKSNIVSESKIKGIQVWFEESELEFDYEA